MNCQSVRNRVLSLPDPREVPDALRAHLDGCPDCLRWWHQAARLERLLAQLPAPPAPAGKKEALIDELTAAGPVIRTAVATRRPVPSPGLAFLRRNWKPVAGLAASVLIVLGGWQLWPRTGPPPVTHNPTHLLTETLVKRHNAVARARTPEQKLALLEVMADDLSSETRGLARVASEDELRALAGWYEKVVGNGIVKLAEIRPAHAMTPDERNKRAELLNRLAGQLATAAQKTAEVTREVPPDRRRVLERIVNAARSGQTELRKLADEGA
jgi:hypothetical protein